MKKQIQSWVALPFLAFAAAGCQGEGPAGRSANTAENANPPRIKAADLDRLLQGDALFLDVREPSELEQFGTLKGYLNIPIGQLEERLDELPRDRPILTA